MRLTSAFRRYGTSLAVLLLLSACTAAGDDGPTGEVPTALPTVEATQQAAEEPLSMTVDEANEILAELSAIQGEIFALMIATLEITDAVEERLEAAFTGPALEAGREALPQFLEQDPELSSFLGGDPVRQALEVTSQQSDCVTVRAERDFSAVIHDAPARPALVALRPHPVSEINQTGWAIYDEAVREDGQEPTEEPCAAE